MLFTGLATKIHCQSGFAPSTAGFYPTSAEASHSERMPEVTERAPKAPVTRRGIVGSQTRRWKRSGRRASWSGIIGINVRARSRDLTLLHTAGHELRSLNWLISPDSFIRLYPFSSSADLKKQQVNLQGFISAVAHLYQCFKKKNYLSIYKSWSF